MMTLKATKERVSFIYSKMIQELGDLLYDYYGEDEYIILLEDIEKSFGHHITNQAEDFATDRFFDVIDSEGNELI